MLVSGRTPVCCTFGRRAWSGPSRSSPAPNPSPFLQANGRPYAPQIFRGRSVLRRNFDTTAGALLKDLGKHDHQLDLAFEDSARDVRDQQRKVVLDVRRAS